MPDEILTLQFGESSNFTGSHIWNIQGESFLRSPEDKERYAGILHRFGRDLSGHEVHTPRLMVFDFRSNFGSLCSTNVYYEEAQDQAQEPQDVLTWKGDLSLHQTAPYPKNSFLRALEEEKESPPPPPVTETHTAQMRETVGFDMEADPPLVPRATGGITPELRGEPQALESLDPFGLAREGAVRVWSDYLAAPLNKWALHPLPFVASGDKGSNPFGSYFSGLRSQEHSVLGPDFHEGWEDAARHYLEECDRFQGARSLVDLEGGYCGLSNELYEYLRDECRSAELICFPFLKDRLQGKGRNSGETVTLAMALSSLQTHASVVCPVSLSRCWEAQGETPLYQASAAMAAALDTALLPCQSPTDSGDLNVSDLSSWARMVCPDPDKKFVSLGMSFPLHLDDVNSSGSPPPIDEHSLAGLFRNVSPTTNGPSSPDEQGMRHLTILRGISAKQSVMVYPNFQVSIHPEHMAIPRSYPHIFNNNTPTLQQRRTGVSWNVNGKPQVSIGATIGYSQSTSLYPLFCSIRDEVNRQPWRFSLELLRNGIVNEDFQDTFNVVLDLCDQYSPTSKSCSL